MYYYWVRVGFFVYTPTLHNLYRAKSVCHCPMILVGNWTTRGYANSRIANSRTGQVADWTTRGLD